MTTPPTKRPFLIMHGANKPGRAASVVERHSNLVRTMAEIHSPPIDKRRWNWVRTDAVYKGQEEPTVLYEVQAASMDEAVSIARSIEEKALGRQGRVPKGGPQDSVAVVDAGIDRMPLAAGQKLEAKVGIMHLDRTRASEDVMFAEVAAVPYHSVSYSRESAFTVIPSTIDEARQRAMKVPGMENRIYGRYTQLGVTADHRDVWVFK